MGNIIDLLGNIMGYIMYACYNLFNDYFIAIVFFTLVSKIILLPISIWVQKNSIKMVRMMPEINIIKTRYYGNQNKISEEQMKLYKREHYHILADLIPLFLQIIILFGVVNVIYNPLTHILHLPKETSDILVSTYAKSQDISMEQAGLQVMTSQDIISGRRVDLYEEVIDEDVIIQISNLDFVGLGFDLAAVPSHKLGKYILIPIIAALSAFMLSFAQNKANVLQMEQSKFNKVGTTLFSVVLSLYLGFFVPVGVGIYWIFSNLFAIIQLFVLNKCINPVKYIDYDELESSRNLLHSMEGTSTDTKNYKRDPYQHRCNEDYKRFIKQEGKQLVFYSENKGFYKYYKDVIEYILDKSDIIIHYVTSDPEDTIFSYEYDHMKTYYVNGRKLIYLMLKMDADIVVMTTPDLEKYHIKRSIVRKDIEYIYLDHGIGSDNLTLRKNALDYFDTLFVSNQISIDEHRAVEKLNQVPAKRLVKFGCCVIDNMINGYEAYCNTHTRKDKKTILIAPSWQKDNIMDLCVTELLDELKKTDYNIIVRPHPQYTRHCIEQLNLLTAQYEENHLIEFQTDFSSNAVVYEADVLITDWSSIAFEYAFSTLHPVLFINTPMKIMNIDYDKINIVPMDIILRNIIGKSIEVNQLNNITETVNELMTASNYSKERMIQIRDEYLFNVGKSGKIGATYLMKRLG